MPTSAEDIRKLADRTCLTCGVTVPEGERYCSDHKADRPTRGSNTAKSKPASTPRPTATPRANSDVAAAVNSLETMYKALSMGLGLFGAETAKAVLDSKLDDLRATNADYLARDPKLAKQLASVGRSTGRAGFFAAQAMVLVPVAVIAQAELKERFRAQHPVDDTTEASTPGMFGVPLPDDVVNSVPTFPTPTYPPAEEPVVVK